MAAAETARSFDAWRDGIVPSLDADLARIAAPERKEELADELWAVIDFELDGREAPLSMTEFLPIFVSWLAQASARLRGGLSGRPAPN